ncbi:hypothetical protein M434DRAFT_7658 [Hypoxylon sp. CO27-5]|nr:hypothetical protein M434DRAFT_7658 [Hypoxylon sp. CO27-5]
MHRKSRNKEHSLVQRLDTSEVINKPLSLIQQRVTYSAGSLSLPSHSKYSQFSIRERQPTLNTYKDAVVIPEPVHQDITNLHQIYKTYDTTTANMAPEMSPHWNINAMRPEDEPRRSLEIIINKCDKLEETTEKLVQDNRDLRTQQRSHYSAIRQIQSDHSASMRACAIKSFFFGLIIHLVIDSVVRSYINIDAETRMFIVLTCCAVVGFLVLLCDQPTIPPEEAGESEESEETAS